MGKMTFRTLGEPSALQKLFMLHSAVEDGKRRSVFEMGET